MPKDRTLFETKWRKFLSRCWLFQFIPFLDFVLASGSLATGNIKVNSDFDVIIGAKQGRIFTVRAFCIFTFGLLGWRRKKHDHKSAAKNKICLNHFVTLKAYKLSPPYNAYWKKLYQSLVPVYGNKIIIQRFWRANREWMKETRLYRKDARHIYQIESKFKNFLEWLLSQKIGDWLERKLKKIQVTRIEKGLGLGMEYKPRIIYNDNELEFHPYTEREEYIKRIKNKD